MSTQKIWDLHMKYDGPITDEFLAGTRELAESIAEEPGVIWENLDRRGRDGTLWLYLSV